MDKKLWADPDRCTGCGICELVCSLVHENQWTHALSRIRILMDPQGEWAAPLFCRQCEDPPCEIACLMNVIHRNPETGQVERQTDRCIGCRACEVSCPLVGCFYNGEQESVQNCDLCEGHPACVEYCPEGALFFTEAHQENHQRRRQLFRQTVIDY